MMTKNKQYFYYQLSLLTGIITSVLIFLNGELANIYGLYTGTLIAHLVAVLGSFAVFLFKKENFTLTKLPWYLYSGGAVGLIGVVVINISYGRISVTAILALGLLAQSIVGLIIDQFGLLGMPQVPFSTKKLIGISLVVLGIIVMITDFELVAVILSFLAGVIVIYVRTCNARLSDEIGLTKSALVNFFVGTCAAMLAFLFLGRGEIPHIHFDFATSISHWYLFTAGLVGVCVVFLSNATVSKISAFYFSLFLFTGKTFSGVILDIMIANEFCIYNLFGAILVTLGLAVNLIIDKLVPTLKS